jgi:RHS repeat-associated protein
LFEEQLQYDQVSGVTGINPVAQYNGNIASQSWGTSSATDTAAFVYTYDPLNRLVFGMSADSNYAEHNITYDLGGNIQTLSRVYNGDVIDSLSYNYVDMNGNYGNQLQQITKNSTLGSMYGAGIGNSTYGYVYDGNGNMTADTRKGISTAYNILNLPNLVNFSGSKLSSTAMSYIYDAGGQKLGRLIWATSGSPTQTFYISGIQYDYSPTLDSLTLSFVETEDGRVFPYSTDTANYYEYYLADHLGNNRIAFDNPGGAGVTVEQQDDYLPFGMEIAQLVKNPKNEYLYNGKELQELTQLYDYGARFYDPVIGRWTTVDPLAEEYRRWSTYNYVDNNPMRLTDSDGMAPCDGCRTAEAILGGGLIIAGGEIAAAAPTVVGEAIAVPAAVVTAAGAAVTAGAVLVWHSIFGPSDSPAPPSTSAHTTNAYAPNVPLSRDKVTGKAKVDKEAEGVAHTQLGTRTSKQSGKSYAQGRTFDEKGNPVKDVDHTDHGRPDTHSNPHQHVHTPNPSGSPQRGPAEPVSN